MVIYGDLYCFLFCEKSDDFTGREMGVETSDDSSLKWTKENGKLIEKSYDFTTQERDLSKNNCN